MNLQTYAKMHEKEHPQKHNYILHSHTITQFREAITTLPLKPLFFSYAHTLRTYYNNRPQGMGVYPVQILIWSDHNDMRGKS